MDKQRIYIDADNGSWGGADNIVTLLVTPDEIEELIEMNDNQVKRFAAEKLGAE